MVILFNRIVTHINVLFKSLFYPLYRFHLHQYVQISIRTNQATQSFIEFNNLGTLDAFLSRLCYYVSPWMHN